MKKSTTEKETKLLDLIRREIKGTKFEDKVFLVGGAVRDEIMGSKNFKDLDFIVNLENGGILFAEWITKRFNSFKDRSNPIIFPKFGTAKFNLYICGYEDIEIEAVMPRQENYANSRKPEVQFASLRVDALRRDFSMNTLMKNISTRKIIDPLGKGFNDIHDQIIDTSSDPDIIFKDDPLRMLRAIRFYAKLGFRISDRLLNGIKRNSHFLESISQERIQEEFNQILLTNRTSEALRIMLSTGLMNYIIPELLELDGLEQTYHHQWDALEHTLRTVENTSPKLMRRMGALLHDIAKARVRSITEDGKFHFFDHQTEGEKLAEEILIRLKYSSNFIKGIKTIVKNHMRFKMSKTHSDKLLRKFRTDVGEYFEAVLDVIHADNISHGNGFNLPNQIPEIRKRFINLDDQKSEPNLPINGNDIMEILRISPGPEVGKVLNLVKEAWFENPDITKKEAIEIIKRVVKKT